MNKTARDVCQPHVRTMKPDWSKSNAIDSYRAFRGFPRACTRKEARLFTFKSSAGEIWSDYGIAWDGRKVRVTMKGLI